LYLRLQFQGNLIDLCDCEVLRQGTNCLTTLITTEITNYNAEHPLNSPGLSLSGIINIVRFFFVPKYSILCVNATPKLKLYTFISKLFTYSYFNLEG